MPLIPFPVDTTPLIAPLIAPPPVATAMTRTADTGQTPPRATESGTSVLARALRVSAAPAWLDRLVHDEPAWPDLFVRDELNTAPTGTVTYDIAMMPLRIAEPEAVTTTELGTDADRRPGGPGVRGVQGPRALADARRPDRRRHGRHQAHHPLRLGARGPSAAAGDGAAAAAAPRGRGCRRRPARSRGRGAWLAAGSPSPVELLLDGRLDAVDERVGELVFARTAPPPPAGAYMPDDETSRPPKSPRGAAERGGRTGACWRSASPTSGRPTCGRHWGRSGSDT